MAAELESVEELDADERDALEALLFRLADDEFVLAERYTEWQVRAPTLESDLALANNAQDELGHARLWYDVLEDLGYEEHELVYERPPDEWRHATVVERPIPEGGWDDTIVRHYLYDVAEELRLEALADSRYAPVADRVGKIQAEESYHVEHAQNWMERLAGGEGKERLEDAVNELFPHALTLFVPVSPALEEAIVDAGFRTRSLEELAEEWLSIVVPFLEGLDLEVPVPEDGEITDEQLPDELGRDGTHTDAWEDLYEDFTHTYRELGRSEATTIMDEPA